MIADSEGIPLEDQRLIFNRQFLMHDYERLSDYGIVAESMLHLVMRMIGGGAPPKPSGMPCACDMVGDHHIYPPIASVASILPLSMH